MRGIFKYSAALAVAVALSLGLSGCGGPSAKKDVEISVKGKKVFEAGLQYVQIVDRDLAGPGNDHPFSISSENMREVLESIYVTQKVLLVDRQSPLFSAYELQVLSTALPNAFERAESDEDVTFVLNGAHRGTLTTETQTNSARMFMSGGRLNIIFGLIREEYRDKDPITGQPIDRRVDPLRPGSRKTDSEPNVRVALDNGQSYYIDPKTGEERKDWIVIDIPTVLATAAQREAEAGDGFLSAEQKEAIARNTQETNNLRDDMANIKEVLFEMSDKLDKMQKELEGMKAE
jgi:hypothetical protein